MQTYRLRPTSNHRSFWTVVAGLCVILLALTSAVMWRTNHYSVLSVQSASMAPLLEPGDAVMLKRVAAGQLKPGNIISYRSETSAMTVTHRIITIAPNGRIITQGDENTTPDAPIDPSRIIGVAEMRLPYAGFALDFMRSPAGLIALVYLPALLLVALEVQRLVQHFRPVYRHYSMQ